MLLNTTVLSVNNLHALRQVVGAAIANAASHPVAIQEAVAQVGPGKVLSIINMIVSQVRPWVS